MERSCANLRLVLAVSTVQFVIRITGVTNSRPLFIEDSMAPLVGQTAFPRAIEEKENVEGKQRFECIIGQHSEVH